MADDPGQAQAQARAFELQRERELGSLIEQMKAVSELTRTATSKLDALGTKLEALTTNTALFETEHRAALERTEKALADATLMLLGDRSTPSLHARLSAIERTLAGDDPNRSLVAKVEAAEQLAQSVRAWKRWMLGVLTTGGGAGFLGGGGLDKLVKIVRAIADALGG